MVVARSTLQTQCSIAFARSSGPAATSQNISFRAFSYIPAFSHTALSSRLVDMPHHQRNQQQQQLVAVAAAAQQRAAAAAQKRAAAAAQQRAAAAHHHHQHTFSSFEDVVNSAELVLVDFHASWCGPCKLMDHTLHDISHRFMHSVKIVKINTEKYPHLASRYAVDALPTLMLFRHGQIIDRIEGALPPEELLLRLASLLPATR